MTPTSLFQHQPGHCHDWRNPIHKFTKISISGDYQSIGMTMDYPVELEKGEYLYSSPWNPTPDYRLFVRD